MEQKSCSLKNDGKALVAAHKIDIFHASISYGASCLPAHLALAVWQLLLLPCCSAAFH